VLLVYKQAMKFSEEISLCLVTESGVHFNVHVTVCGYTILTCSTAGWTCSVITLNCCRPVCVCMVQCGDSGGCHSTPTAQNSLLD